MEKVIILIFTNIQVIRHPDSGRAFANHTNACPTVSLRGDRRDSAIHGVMIHNIHHPFR